MLCLAMNYQAEINNVCDYEQLGVRFYHCGNRWYTPQSRSLTANKIFYMKKSLLILFQFLLLTVLFAQQDKITLFASRTDGYSSYRIPAIIALPGGKLLAFCEGRVNDAGDFGNVDIVMKVSINNGKTWGPLQLVIDNGNLQAGNPAPVLDMLDPAYPQGRIFLFYNTGNNYERAVREGKGLREVFFVSSADGGKSWSTPVNITTQVHRPQQPRINSAYNFSEDWRSYALTPGHAIQLKQGRFNGRLFVAANHSSGNPQQLFKDYQAHGFYSDDHGKTFHLAGTVNIPGSNETMAVELNGNRLMMNMRDQSGEAKARLIAISNNGGDNWDSTYVDHHLPDPVCQGSILALEKNTLAFCNAADTVHRNNLTVRISVDNGKSWPRSYLIDKGVGDKAKDFTAYSDLVSTLKNELGILYERAGYKEIVFTRLKWR